MPPEDPDDRPQAGDDMAGRQPGWRAAVKPGQLSRSLGIMVTWS